MADIPLQRIRVGVVIPVGYVLPYDWPDRNVRRLLERYNELIRHLRTCFEECKPECEAVS